MPTAVEVPTKQTAPAPVAALLGLAGASLAMELEATVHSIAIVGAASSLRMDGAERALAASICTLCIAAFILATGSLGDRLGRKRVMLLGLAVSMTGGVITALATSPVQFAVARAVARWLALQGIGIVVLCLLGGYLAGVSWRLAYLLSPAVAAVALLWCLQTVPEAKDPAPGPFDAPGLFLVAVGLVGTLYGISNAASAGWTSTKVQLPLLVGFAVLI